MGFLKKLKKRRTGRRTEGWPGVYYPARDGFLAPKRRKERIANRRKFRVEVSGNRKWIMIGVAVVAVCATIVYLSVTYGGGFMGLFT